MIEGESNSCSSSSITLGEYEFCAEDGVLVARDRATQNVRFRLPLDHPTIAELRSLPIKELCATPDGKGVIVLLEPAVRAYRRFGNLLRVDLDGSIAWWAEMPGYGTTSYYSMWIREGKLWAFTPDGFDNRIDEHTGQVIEHVFVK